MQTHEQTPISTPTGEQRLESATLEGRNKLLGFWLFMGGESVLFGSLFGTYLGLRNSTADGPAIDQLVSLPFVAVMTFILLTSSLTSALAIMAMRRNNFTAMMRWFFVTVVLGLTFLSLEIYEFQHFVRDYGLGMSTSPFGSAFYLLLGFHGAHVLFGVIWIITLMLKASRQKQITTTNAPKFYVFSLYWHYVDVVWVLVFTVVYLMGRVG